MAMVKGAGTPTALKLLRGERTSRVNHDEPQPGDGIPQCPTEDPQVREVWDYTLSQLLRMRTITMADRDALHAYCEQVVVHRLAALQVREDGAVIYSPRGVIKHPAAAVMRESAVMIAALGRAFGLTPAARTAIKVADQQPAKDQPGPSRLLSS